MATLDSIEAQLKSYRFSLLDTFTDDDDTALASHDPEINFSARAWLKQNGQNMVISDEGGGVFVAKPVADDFTPARTLYTMDAGSENYIIRARLSGFRVAPGMLMFRVAANDSYYGILFNHDTVASYLRIFEFNGDETTTLAEVNPGSLVSESYHWYQIHVAGSRVRAFVEGFNVEAVAEMSINLSETRIGIGGQRASTKFDAIEVIPLQPGAAGEAFSTKLDVLTASTELLATSVPSAITGLKGELGAAAVAAMNANPPDVVTDSLSAAAQTSLVNGIAALRIIGQASGDNSTASPTDLKVFQGETVERTVSAYLADGVTPRNLQGEDLEILFETEREAFVAKITQDNLTVVSNAVTFAWPAAVTADRKRKKWALRDPNNPKTVFLYGNVDVEHAATKTA